MYYRDLCADYLAKGGDTSRETSFGDRNWDDVVDPEMQTRLEVVFNHDTGDVRAVRPDRTIILVGNITARWGHEESIRWFREPNRGDWPPRPLSRFREIIETVNRCCDIQERLGALPKAHEGDLCIICGKPAHVRYRGQPNSPGTGGRSGRRRSWPSAPCRCRRLRRRLR